MPTLGSAFVSSLVSVALLSPPVLLDEGPAESGAAEPSPSESSPAIEDPFAESEPAPAEQPAGQPQPAQPGQPAPQQQQPAPAPEPVPVEPAKSSGNPGAAINTAKGIKYTVMGSIFLGFGAVGLGVGIPTILSGVERNKIDDGSGSVRVALGAAATGLGGLLTLWGVIILPIGIARLVRAKRMSVSLDWDPGRSWTAGVRFNF